MTEVPRLRGRDDLRGTRLDPDRVTGVDDRLLAGGVLPVCTSVDQSAPSAESGLGLNLCSNGGSAPVTEPGVTLERNND